MLKIDKGLALPAAETRYSRLNPLYPLRDLQPGDSFLVPKDKERSARVQASKAAKRMRRVFACIRTPEGLRVYRLDDTIA